PAQRVEEAPVSVALVIEDVASLIEEEGRDERARIITRAQEGDESRARGGIAISDVPNQEPLPADAGTSSVVHLAVEPAPPRGCAEEEDAVGAADLLLHPCRPPDARARLVLIQPRVDPVAAQAGRELRHLADLVRLRARVADEHAGS